MITSISLQKLKKAIDIVDHISTKTNLNRQSVSFHHGVFTFPQLGKRRIYVSRSLQWFKYQGNLEHYNVIEFEMMSEGLNFWQAAHKLAEEYDIELTYTWSARLEDYCSAEARRSRKAKRQFRNSHGSRQR
ncbi:CHC2 zinc finger domain-containing protein [Pelagicoccus mobilis]|uniref:Zinc finger CHC2-type domain-containing protein n=1 Tax=Pelagicoccus mobilis TaxID=415221 RepID=A0A934VPE6_9BACT|nr:CHC2 zinc finger domain-containing protein [Pelagicoccus mobilis]MBK1877207.1 hypothetical protein [Pelagicoccus mobilis]